MKFETWVKQQIEANKKQIKSYQDEIKVAKLAVKALEQDSNKFLRLNNSEVTPVLVEAQENRLVRISGISKQIRNFELETKQLKAQNSTLSNLSKRKLAKVDGLLIHYGLMLDYAKKLNASRLQVTTSIRNNELQLHYSSQTGTKGLLSLFDITAQLTDAPNDLTYDTYTLEDVQTCFKY